MGRNKFAYVTVILMIINTIVFLYLSCIGPTQSGEFMMRHGAVFAPMIIEGGEYWRLFTAMFLHFDINHIMNNMLILFIMGNYLERAMGRIKFLLLYLISGLGANVISMLVNGVNSTRVAAGASGAVFGVIGGLLYVVLLNRGQLEDLSIRQLVIMVVLSLYFGYASTGIDNLAHVAGLILGFLLAILLYRRTKRKFKDFI